MAEQKKKRAPKFHVPKKGEKCVKSLKPKGSFHKNSFRLVATPDRGKGKAFVMVGCPLMARSRNMPRSESRATRWNPAAPIGEQCVFAYSGKKAGLKAHIVTQPRSGGSCRTGYSRE